MKDDDAGRKPDPGTAVTRRDFMKISGIGVAVPLVLGPTVVKAAGEDVAVYGPGKVPVTLMVNGRKLTAQLEPRVTLLDALRDTFNLTGAKRVCDRGVCGACTVMMDGEPVYACGVLAIDAQAKSITTIEGLTEGDSQCYTISACDYEAITPVMQAFVDHDAQQCGFCTPGFIVATTHFLEQHPNPTSDDIRRGLSGNFCRCGTYDGIRSVALTSKGEAARLTSKTSAINLTSKTNGRTS
jgi:xanthine dehydrogenase YagT iron-sulfur-binding subunit